MSVCISPAVRRCCELYANITLQAVSVRAQRTIAMSRSSRFQVVGSLGRSPEMAGYSIGPTWKGGGGLSYWRMFDKLRTSAKYSSVSDTFMLFPVRCVGPTMSIISSSQHLRHRYHTKELRIEHGCIKYTHPAYHSLLKIRDS